MGALGDTQIGFEQLTRARVVCKINRINHNVASGYVMAPRIDGVNVQRARKKKTMSGPLNASHRAL